MTVGQLQARYTEVVVGPVRSGSLHSLFRRVARPNRAMTKGDLSQRARKRACEATPNADLPVASMKHGDDASSRPVLKMTWNLSRMAQPELVSPGASLQRAFCALAPAQRLEFGPDCGRKPKVGKNGRLHSERRGRRMRPDSPHGRWRSMHRYHGFGALAPRAGSDCRCSTLCAVPLHPAASPDASRDVLRRHWRGLAQALIESERRTEVKACFEPPDRF
jgi:hypothetical protein